MKVAIFISGTGTNMLALAKHFFKGALPSVKEIAFVLSNKKNAEGLVKAEEMGIKTMVLNQDKNDTRESYDMRLLDIVRKNNIDIIVLAGFMRILSPFFIKEFTGKIINIHPSILPSFKGLNAQKQAYDAGVKISGCTVHFVDESLDGGPIILQTAVERKHNYSEEDFKEAILAEEHNTFYKALEIVASKRYNIFNNFVEIKE